MAQYIQWQQCVQNFDCAVVLLREAFEIPAAAMSNLEQEGMIRRMMGGEVFPCLPRVHEAMNGGLL